MKFINFIYHIICKIIKLIENNGGMSEWLKEHAWKVCIRKSVSRVRIPFSPP